VDWVKTPVVQFFVESDVQEINTIYERIQNIALSPQKITSFCNENHIIWNPEFKAWEDNAYTYTYRGGRKPVAYNTHVGNPAQKPVDHGAGSSYTTLGKSFSSPLRYC
jgi:hypothetical protein